MSVYFLDDDGPEPDVDELPPPDYCRPLDCCGPIETFFDQAFEGFMLCMLLPLFIFLFPFWIIGIIKRRINGKKI